jgi:hypothetical protein
MPFNLIPLELSNTPEPYKIFRAESSKKRRR